MYTIGSAWVGRELLRRLGVDASTVILTRAVDPITASLAAWLGIQVETLN
jgi:hypothetical protein